MQRRGKKIEKGAVHARVDAFPELYLSSDANKKKKRGGRLDEKLRVVRSAQYEYPFK